MEFERAARKDADAAAWHAENAGRIAAKAALSHNPAEVQDYANLADQYAIYAEAAAGDAEVIAREAHTRWQRLEGLALLAQRNARQARASANNARVIVESMGE